MTDLCNSNLLISINHALDNIYSALSSIDGDEVVSLHTAQGRVLSESCIAPFNLPAYPNSSMDGYAFNSADIQASDFNLQQVGV